MPYARKLSITKVINVCIGEQSHLSNLSVYFEVISTRWSSLLGGIGGGGKFWQHASCANVHITFAAFGKPSVCVGEGGGTGVERHPTIGQRNVEMK